MSEQRLNDCQMVVTEKSWSFAHDNATAIAEHWIDAVGQNPKLFDGDLFVVDNWAIHQGVLAGQSMRTKFSAYIYWRAIGYDDGATDEAFATTIVRAADGGILLARAVAGSVNGGEFVSPGGFLDARDVDVDGRLDLAGAAARELAEETGLCAGQMQRQPGFALAHSAPFLAVASVFQYPQSSVELLAEVKRFLENQAEPELEAPCIVHEVADIEALPLTLFARLLTTSVLA